MAEETIVESDEAQDWESDEAIAVAESEDTAEDIGERARRWRRQTGRPRPFQSMPGVRGIALPSADGRSRNVRFPTPLATAAATNRGLAKQEIARRALDDRLDRLEARFRVQEKNDSSASGLVSLVIGGGLTAYGAIEAVKQTGGSRLGNWASETSTKMAALTSVSQIATSGAKLVINKRYHGSAIGIAADIFAAVQIATFAFASLYKPEDYEPVADQEAAKDAMKTAAKGTLFLTQDTGEVFRVEINAANVRALRLLR